MTLLPKEAVSPGICRKVLKWRESKRFRPSEVPHQIYPVRSCNKHCTALLEDKDKRFHNHLVNSDVAHAPLAVSFFLLQI